MSKAVVTELARRLLNGEAGDTVLADLRAVPVGDGTYTLNSLNNAISAIRGVVMDAGHRSPEYEAGANALRTYVHEDGVGAFLDAPLKTQCATQRIHKSKPTWSAAAEHALQAIRLLPSNMDSFKVSHEEVVAMKRAQAAAQLARNQSPLVIADAPRLLKVATAMLETAKSSDSYATLVLPLLLVSGRRSCEILSARSTFAPAAHPMYCVFSGVLKKKDDAVHTMTIPLLVDYATFCIGLAALRHKQLATGGVTHLTNEQIKKRYQPDLARAMTRGVLPVPTHAHAHDLRGVYAAFVALCYTCPTLQPATYHAILGHERLEDSLSYTVARLDGNVEALRGAFGTLHM